MTGSGGNNCQSFSFKCWQVSINGLGIGGGVFDIIHHCFYLDHRKFQVYLIVHVLTLVDQATYQLNS